MPVELNTLSYILLTTIFSAASVIAIQNGKHPDAHPLVLNYQGEFSPLRYSGESATIRSKNYPSGAPALSDGERTITTLSDLYQIALLKFNANNFLGVRNLHKKNETIWV
jgi:long-chain acyl-CoA synthetase